MSAFLDITGKYIVVMAILLNIIVNLKWFKKKNDSNNKNHSKFFSIIKVASVLFLIVYVSSDLPDYLTQLKGPNDSNTLIKTLLFHYN